MDRTMLEQLQNATVYSTSGDKIGTVGQVYLDDQTEQPTFVTVKTGLFGTKETFVPLDRAQTAQGGITVPFEKDFVKDAPNVDADGTLTPEEERRIYEYYSMDYEGGRDRDGRGDRRDDMRDDRDRDGLLDRDGDRMDHDRDHRGRDAAVAGTAAGAAGAAGAGLGRDDRDRGGMHDDRDRGGMRDDRDRDGLLDRDRDRDGMGERRHDDRDGLLDRDRGGLDDRDRLDDDRRDDRHGAGAGMAAGAGGAAGMAAAGRDDRRDDRDGLGDDRDGLARDDRSQTGLDRDYERGMDGDQMGDVEGGAQDRTVQDDSRQDRDSRGAKGLRLRRETYTATETVEVPVKRERVVMEDEDGNVVQERMDDVEGGADDRFRGDADGTRR